jgi:hypothetical protein
MLIHHKELNDYMNDSENKASANTIHFGLSGLQNIALRTGFYPQDIPEDWLLDYYSNEFPLILIQANDLAFCNDELQNGGSFMDALQTLAEDVADSALKVLFNTDGMDANGQDNDTLKKLQQISTGNLSFLSLNRETVVSIDKFDVSASGGPLNGDYYLCLEINERLEARVIRQLIESLRKQAEHSQWETLYVLFMDDTNALENCRNATMLEYMM